MNNLIVYGDSWSYGVGLDDPDVNAFPVLLGKQLNLTVDNRSVPATSIDHLFYYFLTDCKDKKFNEKDIILFCLTGQSRSMYFDDNNVPQELFPQATKEIDKLYYKYFYSKKLADYNFQKNVLLCKLMCDSNKLKSYFVCNWEHPPSDLYGDCNFYPLSLVGILHPERNSMTEDSRGISGLWEPSPFMFNHKHPNKLGHQKISEELSKWINYH